MEKKRKETEELQNKLQEASAMQALTEASALLFQTVQMRFQIFGRDFIVFSALGGFLFKVFKQVLFHVVVLIRPTMRCACDKFQ